MVELSKIPFVDFYSEKREEYFCNDPKRISFRPSAYALIKNDKNEVLMIRDGRCKVLQWELPGGGVEKGETPQEAAVREVKEETGYDITCTGAPLILDTGYIYKKKKDIFYQSMIIIFEGVLISETQGDTNFVCENEIEEIKWVPAEEAKKLPLARMHKKIIDLL